MVAPALLRVVERQVVVWARLWRGAVFSSFVTPLLFLGAMGIGLGDLIDERTGEVGGVPYLVFVAPGLLAASAMQAAAGESLWPVMAGTKWLRFFHAMVATPLRPADVFGGYILWVAFRIALSATAFLAVASLLGAVRSPWAVAAVPAAMLSGAAFAAPLTAYSGAQDTDFRFPLIMRLGVLPLFLFSGTFFPIDQLPGALQPLAVASPLYHGVELCRAATTGVVPSAAVLAGHVAVLAAFVAAGWLWGTRTFSRKLAA
ncbi:MAG: ABC transporter permease [Actinomycetota bacterium]|nr:ABC transporter permease [Actinomycetota bacterium]